MNPPLQADPVELFRTTPDIIFCTDEYGVITDINPSGRRLAGVGEQSPPGVVKLEALLTEEAARAVRAEGVPLARQAGQWLGTTRAISPDHRELRFSHLVLAQHAEGGRLAGFIHILRDVTERDARIRALQETAARFGVLVEHSEDVVWRLDREGRFTFLSPSVRAMLGYAVEELLHRPATEVLTAVGGQTFMKHLPPRLVGELEAAPRVLEIVCLHRDGTEVPAEMRSVPILNASREVKEIQGVFRDLRQRKRAESAARAGERLFRSVVEATPLGMHFYQLDDRERLIFTGANPAADRILGIDHGVLIGQEIEQAFPALQGTEVPERYRAICREGVTWQTEQIDYKDERVRGAFEVHAFSIGPRRMVTMFSEITARKRAEEEVRRLNVELEQRVADRTEELKRRVAEVESLNRHTVKLLEDVQRSHEAVEASARELQTANVRLDAANKDLEAFSYSVSHDLRSPLRNVAGFVDLLRRRLAAHPDEEAGQFMSVIDGEVKRMSRLIESLLALSRVGQEELELETVRPAELVGEVREALRAETEGREIEWRVHELAPVQADRALLRLVFQNFLGNAVKFTRGRAPAVIEIGNLPSEPGRDEIVCYVRDNGAGFNMKHAEKLFGVFQRLHTMREFEGSGVGLANVQRIVRRHGGRVWAEGEEDRGATFFFALPHVPQM